MSRPGAAAVAVFGLSLSFVSPGHSTAQERVKPEPAGASFDRKFVLVNYKKMGDFSGTLLKNVRESKVGGRGFLVGEFAVEGRGEHADFQGVEEWIPMENVDGLMVFSDAGAARRVSEKFMQAAAPDRGR